MSSLWKKQQREKREREYREFRKNFIPLPPPPPEPVVAKPQRRKLIKNFTYAVSFNPDVKCGGSHQFTLTLIDYLKNKCRRVDLSSEYDLLFVVADLYNSLNYIKERKSTIKIVHRLDGLFYDHGYDAGGPRDTNQREVCKLADLIIHQSEYGKQTMQDRGIVDRKTASVVIYNGVNTSFFKAVQRDRLPNKFVLLSSNNSRLKIKRVDRLNDFVHKGIQVIHVGKKHASVSLQRDILTYNAVSMEKLNNFLSSSQAFIHTGDKDTCPNIVLQALATGLPIIYWKTSGSVQELAGKAGLAVEDFNSIDGLLQELKSNYPIYHSAAIERGKLFDIKIIGEQYLEAFRKVLYGEG